MGEKSRRVFFALLALAFLGYVGVQAYRALYRPVQVTRATLATVEDSITVSAIALRDETLIAKTADGVVDYTAEDGEHVSNGGVVAEIYPTAQDAQNAGALAKVQAQITALQNIGTAATVGASDVGVLDEALGESFLSLAGAAGSSDLSGLTDAQEKLLSYLNRKQLATGTVTDFNAEITALQAKAATLTAAVKNKGTALTAPAAGNFSSQVDGFEGAYDLDDIASVSVSDIKKLLAEKPTPAADAAGKLISDYRWYVVGVVSADDAVRMKTGGSVSLRFTQTDADDVPATVQALNGGSGGYAAAFSLGNMSTALSTVRKQEVQVILASYRGIRVDNRYISVVNGKKGVFVRDGNTARFRTISPTYSGNGYTVSAVDTSDTGRLQVYDAIITNRDDLKDGQILE